MRIARLTTAEIRRSDRRSFLGDVDGDGAPGDATATADAAGGPELVDPPASLWVIHCR